MKTSSFIVSETNLVSREQASTLFIQIYELNASELSLDFSKVDFISRSFADQLNKELSRATNIVVRYINCNSEVEATLNAVMRTESVINSDNREATIHFFSTTASFNEYLNTVDQLNVVRIFEELNQMSAKLNPELHNEISGFETVNRALRNVQSVLVELKGPKNFISSNRIQP